MPSVPPGKHLQNLRWSGWVISCAMHAARWSCNAKPAEACFCFWGGEDGIPEEEEKDHFLCDEEGSEKKKRGGCKASPPSWREQQCRLVSFL